MKNVLVILNPIAGARKAANLASRLRRLFRGNGMEAEVFETARRGDAEAAVRRRCREFDAVIAAGGDGTINETAAGLYGAAVPLGIIPLGTGNVLAQELGIPLDIEEACRVAARGALRLLDIGVVRWEADGTQRTFLCMVGTGFDAAVAHTYKLVRGTSSRVHRYVPLILKRLCDFEFSPIQVTVDGVAVAESATSVIVGNTRAYGGPFVPTPCASPYDGVLDVCIFFCRNPRDLLHCLWGVHTGKHLEYPTVSYLRGREIRLASKADVHVQVDGDAVGLLPVTIFMVPSRLSLIAPG